MFAKERANSKYLDELGHLPIISLCDLLDGHWLHTLSQCFVHLQQKSLFVRMQTLTVCQNADPQRKHQQQRHQGTGMLEDGGSSNDSVHR